MNELLIDFILAILLLFLSVFLCSPLFSTECGFNHWSGESRFYFVHSYHVVCDNENDTSSTCQYGYPFTASIEKENIMGVQFHPEKSHRYGMQLLKNFLAL